MKENTRELKVSITMMDPEGSTSKHTDIKQIEDYFREIEDDGNEKVTGVVILHIENKSDPLCGRKIMNLPQNCAVNFQKFPYF